ncbi:hypothetical protein K458DRAFT_183260 [Lentithecium fluviatile CBS 122367]|uniref:Uncharacterized protein n=1 Tax=Lentithecium fluviatile CBS 122367 TaxID=1168545 RepID=A0A6G1IDW7_9PLEO|nr:hypothetical protein K458DRAFT_183260 [Lentithecium fluviatile CBS 122367]
MSTHCGRRVRLAARLARCIYQHLKSKRPICARASLRRNELRGIGEPDPSKPDKLVACSNIALLSTLASEPNMQCPNQIAKNNRPDGVHLSSIKWLVRHPCI